MPWRLEFSNVEQKDLGDLPEISMFSEVSLFFWQNQCEGSVELVLFSWRWIVFSSLQNIDQIIEKIEFRTGMQVVDLWHGQLPKVLRIFRTRCVGKKKTSLVPLIFFEAQATEEMWAYIADSMKFVTNSQISDTKVDWSVIYSNLIHLARCKRYTFWTP